MSMQERIEEYFNAPARRAELVELTSRLVKIKSVRGDASPETPYGPGPAAALAEALRICQEQGFTTHNYENYVGTAACSHTPEDMGRELYAIVDAGCEVLDVIVEHPVYGQLAGALHLRTRSDVDQFLRRVEEHRARPLSALTGGIHLHTLRCPDQEACQNALKALETQGFLLNM